jgi:hypothetical protein
MLNTSPEDDLAALRALIVIGDTRRARGGYVESVALFRQRESNKLLVGSVSCHRCHSIDFPTWSLSQDFNSSTGISTARPTWRCGKRLSRRAMSSATLRLDSPIAAAASSGRRA